MSKNQKPIPAWAVTAANELDNMAWLYDEKDNSPTEPLSTKNIRQVAHIIADAYDASVEERVVKLEAAIKRHITMFDKIMKGPISRERGQNLAEAIRILESNIK